MLITPPSIVQATGQFTVIGPLKVTLVPVPTRVVWIVKVLEGALTFKLPTVFMVMSLVIGDMIKLAPVTVAAAFQTTLPTTVDGATPDIIVKFPVEL